MENIEGFQNKKKRHLVRQLIQGKRTDLSFSPDTNLHLRIGKEVVPIVIQEMVISE
jgi:hypothetical protein